MDPLDVGLYHEFTDLKKPGLQTWIAIGGYSMNVRRSKPLDSRSHVNSCGK